MVDHEEQQVATLMHFEIIPKSRDAFFVFWDRFVDEMHGATAWVAFNPALPCGLRTSAP
jgi:hypothetical protein